MTAIDSLNCCSLVHAIHSVTAIDHIRSIYSHSHSNDRYTQHRTLLILSINMQQRHTRYSKTYSSRMICVVLIAAVIASLPDSHSSSSSSPSLFLFSSAASSIVWSTSVWSDCSCDAASPSQSRTVSCMVDGLLQPDSSCDATSRPASTQSCLCVSSASDSLSLSMLLLALFLGLLGAIIIFFLCYQAKKCVKQRLRDAGIMDPSPEGAQMTDLRRNAQQEEQEEEEQDGARRARRHGENNQVQQIKSKRVKKKVRTTTKQRD